MYIQLQFLLFEFFLVFIKWQWQQILQYFIISLLEFEKYDNDALLGLVTSKSKSP